MEILETFLIILQITKNWFLYKIDLLYNCLILIKLLNLGLVEYYSGKILEKAIIYNYLY